MSATTQYREFVDFPGLSHFWDKAKSYLHTQVTARKRNDAYVPDRSYQELVTFIEKDAPVYPTLRVVDGNSITHYPLYSFTNGVFTFRENFLCLIHVLVDIYRLLLVIVMRFLTVTTLPTSC